MQPSPPRSLKVPTSRRRLSRWGLRAAALRPVVDPREGDVAGLEIVRGTPWPASAAARRLMTSPSQWFFERIASNGGGMRKTTIVASA